MHTAVCFDLIFLTNENTDIFHMGILIVFTYEWENRKIKILVHYLQVLPIFFLSLIERKNHRKERAFSRLIDTWFPRYVRISRDVI